MWDGAWGGHATEMNLSGFYDSPDVFLPESQERLKAITGVKTHLSKLSQDCKTGAFSCFLRGWDGGGLVRLEKSLFHTVTVYHTSWGSSWGSPVFQEQQGCGCLRA